MTTTVQAAQAADSAQNIPPGNNLAMPAFDPVHDAAAKSLDYASVELLPLSRIQPSAFNPRKTFDPDAIAELGASIKAHGLIQPIVVRPIPGGKYEIVAGERRWRAAARADLTEIPARIVQMDDKAALQIAVTENLQRADLNPVEEARGFAMLRDQAGMTQGAIGAAVKRSQPVIAKSLGLLKLPDDVLEHIQQGRLSASHGQVLVQFAAFPRVVSAIATETIERKATTRQLEQDPLFNTWGLRQGNIIRSIYDAEFDRSVCAACPFGAAYKKENYSGGYCLRPEHFDELQTAAKAEQQREINRVVQAAKRDGGAVLDLEKVRFDTYERIHEGRVPAGCTEQCPCRAVGKGHGSALPICTDPKRFKALETAAKRIARKVERENLSLNMTALLEHLRQSESITTEMLAALVWPAIRSVSKAAWIASVEQCVPGQLPIKESPAALSRECLLVLAPADLVRFALHVAVHHELQSHIEQDWHRTETWDFYTKHVPGLVP